MEEKADVTQLPEFDMDGSHFDPPEDFETNKRNDAYLWSISKRMENFALSYPIGKTIL